MPPRNRHGAHRAQQRRPASSRPEMEKIERAEKKAPVTYGDPFIVMEDEHKATFIFRSGQWVPHSMSVVECRQQCQVNQLSQKLKGMTRYEVRCPVGMES